MVSPRPLGAVHGMVVDHGGTLWLCHDGGASVSRWDGTSLNRLTGVEGIAGKQCTGVPHVDARGRVRVGFTDGTILVDDHGRLSTESLRGAVAAMHEARDGSLWVATTRGLFRLRDGGIVGISQRNGLPGDFLTSLVADRSGANLWIPRIRSTARPTTAAPLCSTMEIGRSGSGSSVERRMTTSGIGSSRSTMTPM